MVTFSERLKALRKSKNMKQTEMAELLSITSRHYQDIEYGKIDLPTSKLVQLADYFNVSLDFLTGRSDNPEMHK